MSVHVDFIGRLGNNLFQYSVGRIIAEHHGAALDCQQIPLHHDHPGNSLNVRGPAGLQDLSVAFPAAPMTIDGTRSSARRIEYIVGRTLGWQGQRLPLRSLLSAGFVPNIRLRGFFQRFEYLADYQSDIRKWLTPVDLVPRFHVASHDVVVNIRRGRDFSAFGWILPLSYYDCALRQIPNIGTVFVCGTGIDDNVRSALCGYAPIYFDGSPIETFCFMRRFRRHVLSNSTFSWWAAFLSNGNLLLGPHSRDGGAFAFTGYGDVDLDMRSHSYRPQSVGAFACTIATASFNGSSVSARTLELWCLACDIVGQPHEAASLKFDFSLTTSDRILGRVIEELEAAKAIDVMLAIHEPSARVH